MKTNPRFLFVRLFLRLFFDKSIQIKHNPIQNQTKSATVQEVVFIPEHSFDSTQSIDTTFQLLYALNPNAVL